MSQLHQFRQFRPRSDKVTNDVLFSDHKINGRNLNIFTVPNDVITAGCPRHSEALTGRPMFADKIKHGFRAVTFCQRQNCINFAAVGFYQMIRATFTSKSQ